MSPDITPTKLCPVCGTRLAENAARCVVCGSEFNATPKQKAKSEKAVQGARMPVLTLSLPVALGLLVILLVIGAGVVYLSLKGTGQILSPTISPTPTITPTVTPTPTETLVPSDTPTFTPQPPKDYKVVSGDTCGSIAALFGSSVPDIISLNGLNSTCTNLAVGSTIKVPMPTVTPPPPPTATLEPAAATRAACQVVQYTVQQNDTLSTIAANYAVSIQAIKDRNGLSTDSVFTDEKIEIPLCMRNATPGPSPTPTIPPPYPAPNLLLPIDGAPFTLANDSILLQWSSIGILRANEAYQVTIWDVTAGTNLKDVQYVTDTKYILPVTFRPQDNSPHVMRWWVVPVRQTGSDDQGNPIWTNAGAASTTRDFTWSGTGVVATPTK